MGRLLALLCALLPRAWGNKGLPHGPGLHTTEIRAQNPSALDVAIVMMDNRHFQPADSVAQQKDEPCDDYWSAAAAINRLYAEMHGYHFYLWGDVHNALRSSGCMDGDPWLARAMPDMLNSKVLHPSWQKMLPIYCSLKRYKMALWLDSDIYVTDPQQPLELLLKASGFLESGATMLLSNDNPNSGVCKGCNPEEGYSRLNAGLLLIRNTPTGMEMLRNWMGATFPEWGDRTKVSLPSRSRLHWPWEQLALNHKNMSVYKAYRDEMMVLPYATPINGPHGLYMAHLWGSITGKGKKCKIMRSALKCVLGNHLPDDTTRDCYLHHASQRHANLTHEGVHVGGACGWRPSPTEAGETAKRCRPVCKGFNKKVSRERPAGVDDGAIAPYHFHTRGLKQCSSTAVGVEVQEVRATVRVDTATLSKAEAWAFLTMDS